jgi:CPA2 family monovalent cation:H+ antiporter-2
MGWSLGSGIVFGLALSVASTVVLLRALQERRILNTERGRIAVGWLIVEDIVMVLTLVLLPALVPLLNGNAVSASNIWDIVGQGAFTLGKVAAFVAFMLIIGRRIIPEILHYIAHTGSRELFRLGVLSIALGVAYGAAKLFGVSFALGAFFAGMILSESELSHRAAEESLPLRDAFAVLFFVSVGMLFNPAILVTQFWPVVATVIIIVLGKSIAALLIVLAFRHSLGTALLISASLAQIGEFSFILAGLGVSLALLTNEARDLVLAGALLSILVNPLLFLAIDRLKPWLEGSAAPATVAGSGLPDLASATGPTAGRHVVLVGFGRVGERVAKRLEDIGASICVVDARPEAAAEAMRRGLKSIAEAAPDAFEAAKLGSASALIVSIPDVFAAGHIVEQARAAHPDLRIVARAHSDAEAEYLTKRGASMVVQGAERIAQALVDRYQQATPTG